MRLTRALLIALAVVAINLVWLRTDALNLENIASPAGRARLLVPPALILLALGGWLARLEGAVSRGDGARRGAVAGAIAGWIGAQVALVPVLAVLSQLPVMRAITEGARGDDVLKAVLVRVMVDLFVWPLGAMAAFAAAGALLGGLGGALVRPRPTLERPTAPPGRPLLLAPALLALAALLVGSTVHQSMGLLVSTLADYAAELAVGLRALPAGVAPTSAFEARLMGTLIHLVTLVPLGAALCWIWSSTLSLRGQIGRWRSAARWGAASLITAAVGLQQVALATSPHEVAGMIALLSAVIVSVRRALRRPALPPLAPRLYSECITSALAVAAVLPLSGIPTMATLGVVAATFAVQGIEFLEAGPVEPTLGPFIEAQRTVFPLHIGVLMVGPALGVLVWLILPVSSWLRTAFSRTPPDQPLANARNESSTVAPG